MRPRPSILKVGTALAATTVAATLLAGTPAFSAGGGGAGGGGAGGGQGGGPSGGGGGGTGRAPAGQHRSYTIGLFGDLPYGDAGRAEFPALRADINAAHPAFSLFDGDLKNGKELCDDALYTTSKQRFAAFTSPVVAVPGDNDWTDCHRTNNGGYDPEERLAYERRVLYSTPTSLGRHPLPVARQGPDYPENERFSAGPVTYVGLNVQGSNNNFPHAGVDGEDRPPAEIARQDAEYAARNAADISWLEQAFATAKARHDKAVMVWWQADPNFNNEMALQPEEYDGLTGIVAELRRQTLAFPGQVVLVHGDSHYFKIDKPLNYDNGQVLANFTRVETFGDKNSHWVSATIDPSDPNVFTFRPQIVAANVDDR